MFYNFMQINNGTTYDISPSYPTFDMKASTVVNKSLTQTNQAFNTPTPIIIQMGSNYQPTSSQLASPSNRLPSIAKFLSNLDQKYECDNVYTKFENAFIEEEITVNAIKDLSDEQLQKLGVVKIGWQKNIKQAAQRY